MKLSDDDDDDDSDKIGKDRALESVNHFERAIETKKTVEGNSEH